MPSIRCKNYVFTSVSLVASFAMLSGYSPRASGQEKESGDGLDVQNWSYTIKVNGRLGIACKCEDLRSLVKKNNGIWLRGLKDTRGLETIKSTAETHGISSVQNGIEKDKWRVCDLFYLEFCNLHSEFEGPKASQFMTINDRDQRIEKLIKELERK
jgi:hypothetical protein